MRYAALSYCWGTAEEAQEQLKTTKASLADHRRGISLETMSTVLLDAVTACRAMNIRYLWCDAICILQDDVRDWEEQSVQMGDV